MMTTMAPKTTKTTAAAMTSTTMTMPMMLTIIMIMIYTYIMFVCTVRVRVYACVCVSDACVYSTGYACSIALLLLMRRRLIHIVSSLSAIDQIRINVFDDNAISTVNHPDIMKRVRQSNVAYTMTLSFVIRYGSRNSLVKRSCRRYEYTVV